MTTRLTTNRGSDKKMRFQWKDEEGVAVALNNPRVFDVSSRIKDRLTINSIDLSSGIFEVILEGSDPILEGSYYFRVQAEDSDDLTVSTERILIDVI